MVMDPNNADEMTTCQKKTALQYLMFLKQKGCKKMGRVCADIRKQYKYLTKDNTSVPTVTTEALFLTCLINAMEHRKVATVNIPEEFIQSDMEGDTFHMKLEGKMAYLMKNIDPKIYKKIRNKKKKREWSFMWI